MKKINQKKLVIQKKESQNTKKSQRKNKRL